MTAKIIAVDFDGTICKETGNLKNIGAARVEVITWLIQQRKLGHKLILWTCREGDLLRDAVNWCSKQKLQFDAINENIPEAKYLYLGKSKVIADIYLDDKAMKVGDVATLEDAITFERS